MTPHNETQPSLELSFSHLISLTILEHQWPCGVFARYSYTWSTEGFCAIGHLTAVLMKALPGTVFFFPSTVRSWLLCLGSEVPALVKAHRFFCNVVLFLGLLDKWFLLTSLEIFMPNLGNVGHLPFDVFWVVKFLCLWAVLDKILKTSISWFIGLNLFIRLSTGTTLSLYWVKFIKLVSMPLQKQLWTRR